jgi:3-oxoacyl-[acyl-carrier-protein] synthase III
VYIPIVPVPETPSTRSCSAETSAPARPLKICGVGRYLPHRVVTNDEVGPACGLSSDGVLARCGVATRHRVNGLEETASFMGAAAAREALADAGLGIRDVDLILNASATPEQALPDTAPFLQAQLGLGSSGVPAWTVSAACLSFLAALDVAASLLACGRHRTILIVSSEISSAGLNPADPETGPLFGDGAAAVVVQRTPGGDASSVDALRMETYGEGAALTGIPGCGTKRPPGGAATRADDHLFRMNGPALLRTALRRGRPFIDRLVSGLDPRDVASAIVIPHQPSRAGMELLTVLGFAPARVVCTLERYGNCVAASMPLALCEAVRSGRLARGDRALLIGTGAGVSFGGAVLTF